MLLYIGQSVSLLINQLSIIIMYVSFMKHVLFSHKISTFDVHIDNFVTSWFPWWMKMTLHITQMVATSHESFDVDRM